MDRVSNLWFGGLTLACLMLASAGVMAQAGGAVAAVPPEAKKMKSPVPPTAASIEAGQQLYTKYCRFCHGNTGKGDSTMAPKTMQPSNLTDATWTRGSSEGEIFWVIQNGAPPKFDMKGLKSKLTDQDIWHLVNYVRSLGGIAKSH